MDNAAALRIALLWEELLAKLDTTPTAALGLLDIANSGKIREASALKALEPSLAQAVRTAAVSLPDDEAWGFLGGDHAQDAWSIDGRGLVGRPLLDRRTGTAVA